MVMVRLPMATDMDLKIDGNDKAVDDNSPGVDGDAVGGGGF